jgi:hypothetical protein
MDTAKIISPKGASLLRRCRQKLAGSRSGPAPPKKVAAPSKTAASQCVGNTQTAVTQLAEKSKNLRLACAALSAEELREWLLTQTESPDDMIRKDPLIDAEHLALAKEFHTQPRKLCSRFYIYEGPQKVREVDRQRWAQWIEVGNSASKHDWADDGTQVLTTFRGVDYPCDHRELGVWVTFVMDLDGSDEKSPLYYNGSLGRGEAMHA